MPLDYETLRVIWWLLLGVLLIGFAIMNGFDFGAAMWLPWISATDNERRVIINAMGPTWEGNQVWFVLGGGAIFAAWPSLYAVSFSGFYLAMFVLLMALILRPVGFKYRSKLSHSWWRQGWDWALFIGGFVPSLIFGVAVGNVLQGVPFHFDDFLRPFYTGSFWGLLNPFALLCGLVSVTMLAQQGACFLLVKTEGYLQGRARRAARFSGLLLIVLFILAGVWVAFGLDAYVVSSNIVHDGPSNPLHKEVGRQVGAWLNNYFLYPWTISAPVLGLLGSVLALLSVRRSLLALIFSSLSVFGVVATVGVSMFPFILPSSTNPGNSLLVWDSSSSQLTLFIMFIAAVIFMPLIIMYTAWVYRVLRGKVSINTITQDFQSY